MKLTLRYDSFETLFASASIRAHYDISPAVHWVQSIGRIWIALPLRGGAIVIKEFLSKSRVSIVEDQMLIAVMLEDILLGLGCVSTQVVQNTPAALAAIPVYLPTLALLDLSLS